MQQSTEGSLDKFVKFQISGTSAQPSVFEKHQHSKRHAQWSGDELAKRENAAAAVAPTQEQFLKVVRSWVTESQFQIVPQNG